MPGSDALFSPVENLKGKIVKEVTSMANFSLPGAPKRQKLLMKFRGRKGPYESLPQWITNFEKEVRIELENMRGNMTYTKTAIKEENKKSLEGQMTFMTDKLNEEVIGAKTDFEQNL